MKYKLHRNGHEFDKRQRNTLANVPLYEAKFKRMIRFPSKSHYTNLVIVCIVNIFLTVSTISLNTITILACWKSKELRKKKSYFLIALLSLNDMAIGFLGNPSVVAIMVKTLLLNYECTTFIIFELITTALVAMSFTTLFELNLERYLCITYPFFHRNEVTKPRLFGIALVLWSFAILQTFLRLFANTVARYVTTVTIALFIASLVFMYISIFRNCRKTVHICPTKNKATKNMHDFKLLKSCAIVVLCSTICFIPFSVTRFLKPETNIAVYAAAFWSNTLALAGSSINSIVFFWRNVALRYQAKAILNCGA